MTAAQLADLEALIAERDRLVALKAWGAPLAELEAAIKARTSRVELAQDAYYYGTAADLRRDLSIPSADVEQP